MRKILILLLSIFLCTSCFNYIEINNLVLISGIGIDYKDGKYLVSFETLYQNKENSDSNFEWGVINEVSGKSLSEAFYNLNLMLEKNPYYAHLKLVIISEEIARNHLSDLFDFFLRNNDIRNIFSLVVSDNMAPKDILSASNEYFPVVSERIREMLENNEFSNYIVNNLYFKDIASNYLTKNKDIALTMIGLNEKSPEITKLLVINNENKISYLDTNYSATLSQLSNSKPNTLVKYECDLDKYITVNIYKSKINYIINKNSYNVIAKLNGEIIENNCNINLEDDSDYKNISKKVNDLIKQQYTDLFKYIKSNNADLLGINKKYFNKYRNRNYDYFKNAKYTINTGIELNKKGLIFEVN